MSNNIPQVAVLMAVKDGLAYLSEQIDSILNQEQCQVTLLVSDDCSTDGSTELLQKYAKENSCIQLLPKTVAFGSAGKNFYHLIKEVETVGFDYFAFSDQDDIWLTDKLIRHIQLAQTHKADCVSSNVTAFWADGRERLLDKAQPQRELDYLFESAGPGCTFMMSPWVIAKLKEQLMDVNSPAKEVVLHDWLTYAVCRAYGGKWFIDKTPSVKYRQHQSNVLGANVGIGAKWSRLRKLRQHWYRGEVIKIAHVSCKVSAHHKLRQLIDLLENKHLFSQLKLLAFVSQSRRKTLDRLMLASVILFGFF